MIYNNILLVDDDEDDQEIFLTAVEHINPALKCSVESEAIIALQKLENKELVPDVIFLDLNMPVMNGQQFLVEIKRRESLKDIPIIIFSTSRHEPTKLITKQLGALDFITKPDNFDALIEVLKPVIS